MFQTHGFDESEENLLQSKNDVRSLEKKDRRGSMIPVATTNGTVLSKSISLLPNPRPPNVYSYNYEISRRFVTFMSIKGTAA